MKTIIINRYSQNQKQTLGTCSVIDENDNPVFSAISLERGWLGNERNISCVPTGTYKVKHEYSFKFKTHLWELKDVPNRSECKFHSANFWFQLNGCIALGDTLRDINKDGYRDVLNSSKTMAKFHEVLKNDSIVTLVIN